MGLFTNVEIAENWLPDEYKDFLGWQTKDVIEPTCMEELVLTKDGDLILRTHEREWVDDLDRPVFKGYFKTIKTNYKKLDFHGNMVFYTRVRDIGDYYKFIQMKARFTNGKLEWVKEFSTETRK